MHTNILSTSWVQRTSSPILSLSVSATLSSSVCHSSEVTTDVGPVFSRKSIRMNQQHIMRPPENSNYLFFSHVCCNTSRLLRVLLYTTNTLSFFSYIHYIHIHCVSYTGPCKIKICIPFSPYLNKKL